MKCHKSLKGFILDHSGLDWYAITYLLFQYLVDRWGFSTYIKSKRDFFIFSEISFGDKDAAGKQSKLKEHLP